MTGGLYDLEFALAALAVLFIAAGSMVWVTPKSAEYLSELLTRRARALTAARVVYRSVWCGEGTDAHTGSYERCEVNLQSFREYLATPNRTTLR